MKNTFHFHGNVRNALGIICLCGLLALSCSKSNSDKPDTNNPVNYAGAYVKSNDQVVTTATGTVTASFDPATRKLTYQMDWKNLTSKLVDMHIHDLVVAQAQGGAGIIIPIEGFPIDTAGTFSGTATLTADQANDLAAAKLYFQIHTENYPGGEVIATLAKTTGGGNTNPGGDGGNGGDGGYVY